MPTELTLEASTIRLMPSMAATHRLLYDIDTFVLWRVCGDQVVTPMRVPGDSPLATPRPSLVPHFLQGHTGVQQDALSRRTLPQQPCTLVSLTDRRPCIRIDHSAGFCPPLPGRSRRHCGPELEPACRRLCRRALHLQLQRSSWCISECDGSSAGLVDWPDSVRHFG